MAKVESLKDVQTEIERLREQLESLEKQNSDLELSTRKRLNEAFDRIDSIDSWASFIDSIASLPGVKQPKWYKIEVPFEYNDVQERFGQVQISASGPFVCTQMQSYYKVTESDADNYASYYTYPGYPSQPQSDSTIAKSNNAVGRVIAPTSFFGLKNREWGMAVQAGGLFTANYNELVIGELFSKYSSGGTDYWYEGWSYPELDVRIQTANNNSYWTGLDSIPSAALYGFDSPLYLATPSIVQASDSIVAFARPTTATVPLKGTFVLEMHGYHIGLHADIEDLLGV